MNMTWEKWQSMTRAERDAARDDSALHPALRGFEGMRVKVEPAREFGRSSFIVGKTTGWKPVHLAIARINCHGSSDVIRADEKFRVVSAKPVR